MSRLRLNPLTGRWITVVAGRAERPSDFAPRTAQVEADPSRPCPFCPGAEDATPPALETYRVGGGSDWVVRVVPNLFPAFSGGEPLTVTNDGPVFISAPASGIHEVLVLSPQHSASFADLDDVETALVMAAVRDRMEEHASHPVVRYTQAIVNHGREAGASLVHPHAQLLGMPFVPGAILEEEAGFGRFEGNCLLCATVEAELADDTRIVLEGEHAVVICPYWSETPYEMLIIPKEHRAHLTQTPEADLTSVGLALRDATSALRYELGDVAYNVVFHTAPFRHDRQFHWHLHVWPILVSVAGFERGTGVMINITPPEFAASQLRRSAV
ncbi:MAG TPA: galactose-1-phosphate uridylyltransferase [Acidimicrobiales bacterium]|nr:galactose-1-phosphate uridylyltransferase [Acidimicrobiales bacterium]